MKVAEVLRMLHDDGIFMQRGAVTANLSIPLNVVASRYRENQAMTSLRALSAASLSKLS